MPPTPGLLNAITLCTVCSSPIVRASLPGVLATFVVGEIRQLSELPASQLRVKILMQVAQSVVDLLTMID